MDAKQLSAHIDLMNRIWFGILNLENYDKAEFFPEPNAEPPF